MIDKSNFGNNQKIYTVSFLLLCYNSFMRFLDPLDALRQFGVYGAQDVADLGTGSGHFALHAAPRLEGGRLFAVDIEKEMLSRLVSEAKHLGHTNIHPIWGDLSSRKGVPLSDGSIDKAIASNILFQIDDREIFAKEIKRMLKPKGKVLVIDWNPDVEFGPHTKHRLKKEEAHALFERHGFKKDKDIDAGDYHYGMIFARD